MKTGTAFILFLTAILTLAAGSAFGAYSGGSGTETEPYQINDITGWQELMTTSGDWSAYFILTADVNLYGVALTPVGNSTTKFTGVIDGGGHVISNAAINTPTSDRIGLFGYALGSRISNINITLSGFAGRYFVGGLVGFHEGGTIENCNVAVQIQGEYPAGGVVGYNTGALVSHCTATGTVAGPDISTVGGLVGENSSTGIIRDSWASAFVTSASGQGGTGGLVGSNYGTVLNCVASGQVSGSSSLYKVGGLIGQNSDTAIVARCRATGAVIGRAYLGGLIGINSGTVTMCFATGTVTGNSSAYYIGGLVGDHYGSGGINDSYATGAVSAGTSSHHVAGLVGIVGAGTVDDCYSTGMVTAGSGSYNVYGLIGGNSGSANGNFWDTNTSGRATSPGGTGLSTLQMKQQASFTGWDFTNETVNGTNDVWRMCADGVDYPRLNWESIAGDFACPDGVTMEDLSYFVQRWVESDCTSSNNFCGGSDINGSGKVDFTDFAIFAANWLTGE